MSKTVPFQTIQFSISTQFKCKSTVYLSKTFLFQAIRFSQTVEFCISMQFISIQPIDRARSGATIPGQTGPGSNGNEGVLRISQSSSINGTSPSDCLVSILGHSLEEVAVGVFYSTSRQGKSTIEGTQLQHPWIEQILLQSTIFYIINIIGKTFSSEINENLHILIVKVLHGK